MQSQCLTALSVFAACCSRRSHICSLYGLSRRQNLVSALSVPSSLHEAFTKKAATFEGVWFQKRQHLRGWRPQQVACTEKGDTFHKNSAKTTADSIKRQPMSTNRFPLSKLTKTWSLRMPHPARRFPLSQRTTVARLRLLRAANIERVVAVQQSACEGPTMTVTRMATTSRQEYRQGWSDVRTSGVSNLEFCGANVIRKGGLELRWRSRRQFCFTSVALL